ncbi:hypothetical protein ElyMa_004528400 [Elysia marginata]|uniref:Uncharacterized protein n=1 Tax=Elysia marginata TaxID=1093978 RepID=A0AAV4HP10_9GAST|nr:hypothetical protein ElyMa_004528400 [Elysia marginata]
MLSVMCDNKPEKLFRPFESCESPVVSAYRNDDDDYDDDGDDGEGDQEMGTADIPGSERAADPPEPCNDRPLDTLPCVETQPEVDRAGLVSPCDSARPTSPIIQHENFTYEDNDAVDTNRGSDGFSLHSRLHGDEIRRWRQINRDADRDRLTSKLENDVLPSCHSQCLCCAQFCRNFAKSLQSAKTDFYGFVGERRKSPPPVFSLTTGHRDESNNSSPEHHASFNSELDSARYFHLRHLHRLRDLSQSVHRRNNDLDTRATETGPRQRNLPSPSVVEAHVGPDSNPHHRSGSSSPKEESHQRDRHTATPRHLDSSEKSRRLSGESFSGDRDGATSEGEELGFDFDVGEFHRIDNYSRSYRLL